MRKITYSSFKICLVTLLFLFITVFILNLYNVISSLYRIVFCDISSFDIFSVVFFFSHPKIPQKKKKIVDIEFEV